MKRVLLLASALFLVTGCRPATSVRAPVAHERTVVHTSDGRYGYQGDDGFWYWYFMTTSINNSSVSTPTYYVSPVRSSPAIGGSAPASIPSGGTWTRGQQPTEEELANAEREDLQIFEEPLEPEAATEPAEATPETTEAPAVESPAADAPASSADSGGGGDGGGGGGGE